MTFNQTLQAELEEMRAKVTEVQNLGEDIIKNRGEHCKTQIEPKLHQLTQRFEMVARRILHGQVTVTLLRHVMTFETHVVFNVFEQKLGTDKQYANPI